MRWVFWPAVGQDVLFHCEGKDGTMNARRHVNMKQVRLLFDEGKIELHMGEQNGIEWIDYSE